MKIALIVAAARNHVIGRDNKLPWHLPQDLKHFKSVTLGKPIIMGRKTYESIGKPLPGRTNIVITRQQDWCADGVQVVHDLASAIALAKAIAIEDGVTEVIIIGGAEIYRGGIELAQRIYLTRIDVDVDGDAFFPRLAQEEWQLISVTPSDSDTTVPHEFQILERIGQ